MFKLCMLKLYQDDKLKNSYNYLMVITSLEEKQNRKLWVPIREGNRGGWGLFKWDNVREMPYRDREMYLGNSVKIGVLDKGGKWRKKDWYLHKNGLSSGQKLTAQMSEAMRKDQERMNAALGLTSMEDQQEKLTPAELQALLKKAKGGKQDPIAADSNAVGLGFDKAKVEIRAKPSAKIQNPHKLQGTAFQEQKVKKSEKTLQKGQRMRSRSRSQKHKKKHEKEKREDRSKSREKHRKRENRERQESEKKEKRKKERHRQ